MQIWQEEELYRKKPEDVRLSAVEDARRVAADRDSIFVMNFRGIKKNVSTILQNTVTDDTNPCIAATGT